MATISRFGAARVREKPARSHAPARFAQGLITRDIFRVTKGGIPHF